MAKKKVIVPQRLKIQEASGDISGRATQQYLDSLKDSMDIIIKDYEDRISTLESSILVVSGSVASTSGSIVTDHGSLAGLGDNDHPQYALTSSLITDHGGLSGLTDDDHTQYILADGTRTLSGDFNITGNLTVSGSMKHTARFKVVPAASGLHVSSAGLPRSWEITAGFDFYGRFQSAGVGDIMVVPITIDDNLDSDDILTHVYFRYYGSSGATKRFSVISTVGTNSHTIHQTETSTNSGHQTHVMTLASPITLSTNRQVFAQMRTGASNDRFAGIGFYYVRS